ncbi:MAG: hypothetical protein HY716_04405 [Planctomycetes bacterium]|nr:hypothetical protein [Planctomycetota bacterium]
MLENIKRILGLKDIPEELSSLYRGAHNEREALILLKEARRRDESRRRRALQDLEVFTQMEEELLEEGKGEVSESRRLMLARRVKEIRGKSEELNSRIDNIYNKRLRIFNEHIHSLETVLELTTEELPDKQAMEEMAIRAKELLENLEKSRELAEGIALSTEPPQPDEEEKQILKEMERRASLEAEKEEIEPAPPEPAEEREGVSEERREIRKERPREEPKRVENPEIEFEE